MTSKQFLSKLKQYITDGGYGDCIGEMKDDFYHWLEFHHATLPELKIAISIEKLERLDKGGD